MALSIVVPVFNSEATLPLLTERIHAALTERYSPIELILVNDASADGSWETIQGLEALYPWVRGINLMRNFGQHNALLCGIRVACYPLIVTMDDDLQNPPEEAPKLLRKLEEGFDVVYGTPRRESHGLFRDLASVITKFALQRAMGAETARSVSAFRCFRTTIRDAFEHYRGAYVSIDVLLTWGTRRFGAVEVRHDRRASGASNYSVGKLIVHAMNMMTGFSTLPLQVASLVGFTFMLFGLAVLAYVIGRFLIQGAVVPGFAFLASIIAVFSGTQLFALGVIGEYLARMHVRSMGRPSYVIDHSTGGERRAGARSIREADLRTSSVG
jgi:glycosyltransferase involved in cell wall biosynthesis